MQSSALAPALQAISNPFFFSDHEVRTATDETGEAWFCARDVFEALGIAWSQRTGSLKNYPEKWIRALHLQGQSGSGEVLFISEAGLYKALFSSRSPSAIRFTEWVCEEVLPAIRRQGFFGQLNANQQIALRGQKLKLLGALASRDAFVHASVMTTLRNVCNLLGEPMPSETLLGKDRDQLALGLA